MDLTPHHPNPVVVTLSPSAAATARRLRAALPGAQWHGRSGRAEGADATFDDATGHLRALFQAGWPIIGVCASGILIRALAPVLGDKRAEPPVLAISADGISVVPLLGGHRGANRLAETLGTILGGHAALTTAGETVLGLALDDPPSGWRVKDAAAAKPIAAALLAGEKVRLTVERGSAPWLQAPTLGTEGRWGIRVTDRAQEADPAEFVLHPAVLALGVGCERGAEPRELETLALETLAGAGLSPKAVACVVSVAQKADEAAVHALAARLGVPARFFAPKRLEEERPRLANPSEAVFKTIGCHGVAEAAALAAAGPGGELVVPKVKSPRATCAIARAPEILDPEGIGQARGRLFVIGTGPGGEGWRTPEASRALARCSDVVGYKLYLDLIADELAGKRRHDGIMGAEEARVRRALELAAEGRDVALVCSGDPGIYALATLVFELIDRGLDPAWRRIEVAVMPGISAFQLAAARAGALVNHDFCTISLSNLLTPWEVIERRVRAAAEGDFVIAFYNPVSQRRRDQLPAAREILLAHRPADTPVVMARNLGREGESVTFTTLQALDPEQVDMLTIVMVGNSETRRLETGARSWIYTPRGYAKKWRNTAGEEA